MAHRFYLLYEDLNEATRSDALTEQAKKLPVFADLSTCQRLEGSADTVRD